MPLDIMDKIWPAAEMKQHSADFQVSLFPGHTVSHPYMTIYLKNFITFLRPMECSASNLRA
jgi:hypothetical protein